MAGWPETRPLHTTIGPEVKPALNRFFFRSTAARAQRPYQVDDAFADFGIADLDEGTVQLESFAAVQELEDESFGVGFGHPARWTPVADMRRFLEKELNRDVENSRDLEQAAGADAVHALLVFLYLLERQSHALAETLLTHAE